MNIGLFTDTYFPQINGVATSTRILAQELRKKGHKVYIFTTTDPHAKNPEFDVFRLPSVAFIFLKSHRASIMYSPKALSAIRKMDLDIVHTQTEFSLGVFGKIVALRLGLPHVHTFHTMYPDYVHYIANGHLVTPKMAENFCRLCCNVSETVIAPTEKVRGFLSSVGVKRPIAIIPTGMDLEAFSRENTPKEVIEETRRELGIEREDKVIVAVGRLAKEKSIDVLIEAMPEILAEIPEARLVIVGDGPVKRDLEALAEELNISGRVTFAGARPWAEIGRYYALGDVFANASVSEAQGLTFIEAMASGTVVVAKDDPCLRGVVSHIETGLLFRENSELSGVVVAALRDTELREAIAERARENTCKYSAEAFGSRVLEVYEDVCSSSQSNPEDESKSGRFSPLKPVLGRLSRLRRKGSGNAERRSFKERKR